MRCQRKTGVCVCVYVWDEGTGVCIERGEWAPVEGTTGALMEERGDDQGNGCACS